MKQLFQITTILLLLFATASCGEEMVGDWDPIQWKVVPSSANTLAPEIDVPADGATYTLICDNYSSPWVTEIQVDGVYIDFDYQDSQNVWCDEIRISIVGRRLTAIVAPNTTNAPRTISATTTVGDAFSTITFHQSAN